MITFKDFWNAHKESIPIGVKETAWEAWSLAKLVTQPYSTTVRPDFEFWWDQVPLSEDAEGAEHPSRFEAARIAWLAAGGLLEALPEPEISKRDKARIAGEALFEGIQGLTMPGNGYQIGTLLTAWGHYAIYTQLDRIADSLEALNATRGTWSLAAPDR